MQLPESIETYGYFWRADEPNNRLSGILRISEKGDASLEIFGLLDSSQKLPGRQLTGQRLRILGVTDKAGAVTLVDCIVVEQNDVVNIELLSKSTVHAGCVFWGAHFDTEDIRFSEMTFSVEGLDEWLAFHHRPFSTNMDSTGPMSLTYSQPETITFQIPDGLHMGFHMVAGMSSGMFRQTMTTKMSMSISSSRPRSFSDFMQVLRKVRNFLCLAFDRTVSFTSITCEKLEPHDRYKSVVIYGRFDPYDLPREDVSIGNFLISFDEVADSIQDYLARWLERYEDYEPTFNLYFTVTANRYMHIEGGFLFLVHGIESLHRRGSSEMRMPEEEFNSLLNTILHNTPCKWRKLIRGELQYANEPSLRRRMRQMIAPFNDLFGSESARAAFVNQVVCTRNYLTHYDQGIKDRAVTDPHKLLKLRSKLVGLIQLHLLQLLGFEPDQ